MHAFSLFDACDGSGSASERVVIAIPGILDMRTVGYSEEYKAVISDSKTPIEIPLII